MSEKKYQSKIIAGLLVTVTCASLYAWGGMEFKFLRRFIAPSVAAIFLAIVNREWIQLIKAPLLGIASSLGYGADETWLKVIKRAYVGLAFGIGASCTDVIKAIREDAKKWIVVGYSAVAIISAYILFGVWNPVHARVEETLLGFIVYGLTIIPSIKE